MDAQSAGAELADAAVTGHVPNLHDLAAFRALGVDQTAARRDLGERGQDVHPLDGSIALQQGSGNGAGAAPEYR